MAVMALHYPIAMAMFGVGIYCLLFRRNLIKMIIGLELLTDGIHIFLISMGYRTGGSAPIMTGAILGGQNFSQFASQSVDPIPQVLVLTSIVIDISIVALALSLAVFIYSKYKTLNPAKIRELSG